MKLPNTQRIIQLTRFVILKVKEPEFIVLTVIAIVVVAVTINTSSVILKNYELERKVRVAEQKVAIAELELENQRAQNAYYATDAYLEIAARRQLSRGAPGEQLIIVPKSVAEKYVTRPQIVETTPTIESEKSTFQKWVDFLQGDLGS